MIAVRRAAAASRQLRVVIDARMDEGSGGVQQWVIGLAGALWRLNDSPENYPIPVDDGNGAWVAPHLSGPELLVDADVERLRAAPTRNAAS